MNIANLTKRLAALLLIAVSSVAAAPGAGTFLVGYPFQEMAPTATRQFEVLGGWGAGKWINGLSQVVNPSSYTLYNLAGKAGVVKGGLKSSYGVPCEQTYGVEVKAVPQRNDWWIALSAPWSARPRAVTMLPNSSAVYIGVVRDVLVKKGLKNPSVQLQQVVQVDLDGDRRFEIVIAANHFDESSGQASIGELFPPVSGQAGDYGLLIVRKVVAGKLQTFELGADVILKATTSAELEQGTQNNPDRFELVNVLDLNGDGKMEIVMFNAIYEDSAVSALEWDGKKFQQRLISGCGV